MLPEGGGNGRSGDEVPGPTPLLALVGATASGKTEASLPVAEALDAEIVCVDSMLVYRGMDVGTAKPTAADRSRVRHHLLDLVDPEEPFSVTAFQSAATDSISDIAGRGRSPFLVGGSGLYFRAVADDLVFPATEPPTRRLLEAEALVLGPRAMHRRLESFDPDAASRIEPGNARRTIRALEVAAITGRAFSTFAAGWQRYPASIRVAGVEVPRAAHNRRIEERVRGMIPDLLVETRLLRERGFESFLTSSQAIGYAEAAECLAGSIGEDEAAARIIRRTKGLARRQMAWFRRDPRVRWFCAGEDGAAGVVPELIDYLSGTGGM